MLYSPFHTWFACPTKGVLANELEVLGHIVHFLPLPVGNDYKDLITAGVVHAS